MRSGSARWLVAACGLAAGMGCGSTEIPQVVGSDKAPYLSPLGDQAIGLAYRGVGTLGVRYLDAQGNPIAGAVVHFDPPTADGNGPAGVGSTRGSTLASDQAVTDDRGVASISVVAGTEEATFEVIASAPGAEPLRLVVSVSQYPFIAADVDVSYVGPHTDATVRLRVLLYNYDTTACVLLPAAETPVDSPLDEAADGSPATLHFPSLRASLWTLVARAEDAHGHLLGYKCVDFDARGLSAPVTLTVVIDPIYPLLTSGYRLTSTLPLTISPSPIKSWDDLVACPLAPAQQLLDAIVVSLGGDRLAATLEAHRGPADVRGCRPANIGGVVTLDSGLASILSPKGAPLVPLQAVIADLDAAVANLGITTRVSLTATGPGAYVGEFTIETVTFSGAGQLHPASYDPGALGFPLVAAANVAVQISGSSLTVARHGYTLRLPALWGRALVDVALAPRGLAGDAGALIAALVATATRLGGDHPLKGCAAVQDLLCGSLGGGDCAIAPACEMAIDRLGAQLMLPFVPPAGLDFWVAGTATTTAASGSLVADSFVGTFSAEVVFAAPDHRAMAGGTWKAAQIP